MLKSSLPAVSRLFALFAAVLMAGAVSAQQSIVPLSPPQPVENDGKIEVLEFFSYACPHCFSLDAPISAWAKKQPSDVKFKRVPVDGINGYVGGVGLYYTLEAMGELDRMHARIFDAFHVEHVNIANPAKLNQWLEKNGVDVKKFEEMKNSFSIMTKIQRALKMNTDYKISSVPTITVNGRFQVVPTVGSTQEQLLANVDQIVQQSRAAAPAPAKAAAKK
ncbi:MAG: thiol:disulfide interchange protein DsbA/DsbL [Betaproteobacteria bacterium]|nr:thiol:disulfide interchange protein DsbA/DsbL [Betaproteobacteria bacterium]